MYYGEKYRNTEIQSHGTVSYKSLDVNGSLLKIHATFDKLRV